MHNSENKIMNIIKDKFNLCFVDIQFEGNRFMQIISYFINGNVNDKYKIQNELFLFMESEYKFL